MGRHTNIISQGRMFAAYLPACLCVVSAVLIALLGVAGSQDIYVVTHHLLPNYLSRYYLNTNRILVIFASTLSLRIAHFCVQAALLACSLATHTNPRLAARTLATLSFRQPEKTTSRRRRGRLSTALPFRKISWWAPHHPPWFEV